MAKLLAVVFILICGYFAFLKRKEPPKEVVYPTTVSATATAVASSTEMTGTDSSLGNEGSLPNNVTSGTLNK